MSLQVVINNAASISFTRRKVVGQTISRSGHVKIGSIASNVPWVMDIEMAPVFDWTTGRSVVEEIDRLDRVITETVDIGGSNSGLSYITEYQGDLTPAQIAQLSVSSYNALDLVLDISSVTGESPSDYIFKKGDFLSLTGTYKYPYTVTQDTQIGSGSTVTIPLNRPFIDQTGYTEVGAGIRVGNDVTWQVVMTKKPSYSINPGRRLSFNSNFELVEVIED